MEDLRNRTNLRSRRRGIVLILSLAITFVVVRTSLHLSPDTDFNVWGYNIHHLFTGLLIAAASGVPLIIFQPEGLLGDLGTAGFGMGLSLALDEWVYLIATDGSNASYLLPVSFWGGAVIIALTCLYIMLLCRRDQGR